MTIRENISLKIKNIKNIFFLTEYEKNPCPLCNHRMHWNPKGYSEHDYIAKFECHNCKHFEYRGDNWSQYKFESITLKRAFWVKIGVFQLLNKNSYQPNFISEYSEVPKITELAKQELFKAIFNQLTKNHVTQIEYVYKGFIGMDNMTNEQLIQEMLNFHIDPYKE